MVLAETMTSHRDFIELPKAHLHVHIEGVMPSASDEPELSLTSCPSAQRRQHVLAEFKIPWSEELTQRIEDIGMEVLTYQTRSGTYRVHISQQDPVENAELLRELIRLARENYGP